MRIEKSERGTVVFIDNKPVLLNKGLNYLIPNFKVKILGIDEIPIKEVLRIVLSTDNLIKFISNMDALGVDYKFNYIMPNGIIGESIKKSDEYLSCF